MQSTSIPSTDRLCRNCGWSGPSIGQGRWWCHPCTNARARVRYHESKTDYHPELLEKWRAKRRKQLERLYRSPRANEHRDKDATRRRLKYQTDPSAIRAQNQEREAWLRAGDVAVQQLRQIWERDAGKCRYCSESVQKPRFSRYYPRGFDHVISRAKGGLHTASNLVVCCRSCNAKKGARSVEVPALVS